jgi:hypothetical protein
VSNVRRNFEVVLKYNCGNIVHRYIVELCDYEYAIFAVLSQHLESFELLTSFPRTSCFSKCVLES